MKTVVFKFRDCEKEIGVNDIVYVSNCNRHRSGEFTVLKIGTKLITLSCERKFYFDGHERSDYGHNQIYSSSKAFYLTLKARDILFKIRSRLNHLNADKHPKLIAKIANILEIE